MGFLVRIRPHLPVDSFNQFNRRGGWYRVDDEATLKWAREARINDITPSAERVFEVVSEEDALAIAQAERVQAAPAGTPEAPMVISPSPAPPAEVPPPGDGQAGGESTDAGRGRGRR